MNPGLTPTAETIAQHRPAGSRFYTDEFQFDFEYDDDPALFWSTMTSGIGSGWAGYPVDRQNALDMVRDQVAGLGGELRIWIDPEASVTVERVA
jgi:hypothetical protein